MTIIVGDVHGKINEFYKITQKYTDHTIICLGDFGLQQEHNWFLRNMDVTNRKILFGNHDWYPYLYENHSLGDYFYWPELGDVFFIRGANSIDNHMRYENVDWFRNEELSMREWYQIMDNYEQIKPTVVVSHDCPLEIQSKIIDKPFKSITNQGLQELYEIHEPNLWIFGHYHKDLVKQINFTKFVCLNELTILNLDNYI